MSERDILDLVLVLGDKVLPAARSQLGDAQQPFGIELGILVVLQKVLARNAVALGEPHQFHVEADQPLVDVVELLDQRVDAILVERQRLHVGDDLLLQGFVFALLRRRQGLVAELVLDILILQAAQLLVGVGDAVESFEHLRLELGLHRRKRHGILHIVVVFEAFGARRRIAVETGRRRLRSGGRRALALLRGERFGGAGRGHVDLRRLLAVRAGVGRLEVDDVAQQDLGVVQFVAPDDDRLKGQRALAQAGDHRLAARLDAFGDGDFALAGEKLDRAHFTQIHAHRIVGAFGRFRTAGRHRRGARGFCDFAALGLLLLAAFRIVLFRLLGILVIDDVDPHFVQHRIHVLDLIGGDLLGGQNRIQFLMRDPAALLGDFDHPLDRGVGKIEQRAIRRLHDGGVAFSLLLVFLRHMLYSVGSAPGREIASLGSIGDR